MYCDTLLLINSGLGKEVRGNVFSREPDYLVRPKIVLQFWFYGHLYSQTSRQMGTRNKKLPSWFWKMRICSLPKTCKWRSPRDSNQSVLEVSWVKDVLSAVGLKHPRNGITCPLLCDFLNSAHPSGFLLSVYILPWSAVSRIWAHAFISKESKSSFLLSLPYLSKAPTQFIRSTFIQAIFLVCHLTITLTKLYNREKFEGPTYQKSMMALRFDSDSSWPAESTVVNVCPVQFHTVVWKALRSCSEVKSSV